MRHRKAGRKLNRNASHRKAMKRNMARSLFEHGRIVTTLPKAKEMRSFVEKLITLAKKGTLHARRQALSKLPDREVVKKLFEEIGPRYAERPGGYTRVIKRSYRRLGDGGHTAFLELIGAEEVPRKQLQQSEAPAAPDVTSEEETTSEAPATEEQASESSESTEEKKEEAEGEESTSEESASEEAATDSEEEASGDEKKTDG